MEHYERYGLSMHKNYRGICVQQMYQLLYELCLLHVLNKITFSPCTKMQLILKQLFEKYFPKKSRSTTLRKRLIGTFPASS